MITMFQVINLNQEVERECPTRAELMYFLEGEEKRCLSTNTSETFRLLHFDRNGEVLEAPFLKPKSASRSFSSLSSPEGGIVISLASSTSPFLLKPFVSLILTYTESNYK